MWVGVHKHMQHNKINLYIFGILEVFRVNPPEPVSVILFVDVVIIMYSTLRFVQTSERGSARY